MEFDEITIEECAKRNEMYGDEFLFDADSVALKKRSAQIEEK